MVTTITTLSAERLRGFIVARHWQDVGAVYERGAIQTMSRARDLERYLVAGMPRGGYPIHDLVGEDLAAFRAAMVRERVAVGFGPHVVSLLTLPKHNVKLDKSNAYGLSLSPASTAGWNVCRASSPGCRAACLATAGKGGLDSVQRGRLWKIALLVAEPALFVRALAGELRRAAGRRPVDTLGRSTGPLVPVRLNVLSDLAWERFAPALFDIAGLRFYDYTKRTDRTVPANYHLTSSATERTADSGLADLADMYGSNVAVVFDTRRGQALPSTYAGCRVVDGDLSDSRWNDDRGVIVGLRAKGKAIGDRSGFVRSVA